MARAKPSGGKKKVNKNYRDPARNKTKRLQEAAKNFTGLNPFEIRVNKQKHDNLGRRNGRNDKGVPGISRAKAHEKRKDTLLKEYEVRNKNNSLVDKRIGEKDKSMSSEDKMIKRAAKEKTKQYKKKSIFALGDEDILTHKGKPLLNVDRYDDPRDLSDSDDEILNEDFVSEANFGGFLKVKANDAEAEQTREELISQMILDSKKRKHEKAKSADENYELVKTLDDEFKDPEFKSLFNQLNLPSKKAPMVRDERPEAKVEKVEVDDYDKLFQELKFEKRGGPAKDSKDSEMKKVEEEELKTKKVDKLKADILQLTKSKLEESLEEGLQSEENCTQRLFQLLTQAIEDSTQGKSINSFVNLIKICQENFPLKDRKHPLMNPTVVLITQLYTLTKFPAKIAMKNLDNLFRLTEIVHEMSVGSKIFFPEVMKFLLSLLLCFSKSNSHTSILFQLPKKFTLLKKTIFLENFNEFGTDEVIDSNTEKRNYTFKLLDTTLSLITKFAVLYKYLPSYTELFSPIKSLVANLKESATWSSTSLDQITNLISEIDGENAEKEVLKPKKPPIVMLKMHEPDFDEAGTSGSAKRKNKMSREKANAARLTHKVKREMKSAVREIRKDNAFLANHQLREQIDLDIERKRKVTAIMGSLANQEGEFKKLTKPIKKKKKE